jgi:predicted patatin/cPLA2 family phospholipase
MVWDLKVFKETSFFLIVPALLGALFFLRIWQNTEYNQIQKEIQRVTQEKESLVKKNEDLKISILTQTSVEKLDYIYAKSIHDSISSEKTKIITLTLPSSKPESKKSDHEN